MAISHDCNLLFTPIVMGVINYIVAIIMDIIYYLQYLLQPLGAAWGSSLILGNHWQSPAGPCHSITIYSNQHNKITNLLCHLFPSPIQQVAIQVQNINYDTLLS